MEAHDARCRPRQGYWYYRFYHLVAFLPLNEAIFPYIFGRPGIAIGANNDNWRLRLSDNWLDDRAPLELVNFRLSISHRAEILDGVMECLVGADRTRENFDLGGELWPLGACNDANFSIARCARPRDSDIEAFPNELLVEKPVAYAIG